MDIIVGKRQYGKTTHLIKRSAAEWVYILTSDHKRASEIFHMAQNMNLDIPYPITLDEYFGNNLNGSSIRRDGILIDDADQILQMMFARVPIKCITISDSDTNGNNITYLTMPEHI